MTQIYFRPRKRTWEWLRQNANRGNTIRNGQRGHEQKEPFEKHGREMGILVSVVSDRFLLLKALDEDLELGPR